MTIKSEVKDGVVVLEGSVQGTGRIANPQHRPGSGTGPKTHFTGEDFDDADHLHEVRPRKQRSGDVPDVPVVPISEHRFDPARIIVACRICQPDGECKVHTPESE